MEQWEKEFRQKAKESILEGRYRVQYKEDTNTEVVAWLDKNSYIEHQVERERKHRKLLEKDGINPDNVIL